jgi:hypothetical protein
VTEEDRAMQQAEEQRVAWEDATKEGKRSVETADLNPGDVLDVEGTPVRVRDVDLATGEAYLEDGTRFGRQTLANGETIYVESIEEADTTAPELPKYSTSGEWKRKDTPLLSAWDNVPSGGNPETLQTAYLTGSHGPEVMQSATKRNDIGLLVTPLIPGYFNHATNYPYFGVDNGVFSKATPFNAKKFRELVTRIAQSAAHKAKALFVVAPDVVGDAKGTLEKFDEWADWIHEQGLPVALAAQDGLENMMASIPWDKVDVLFVGGSTAWKTGALPDAQRKAWNELWMEAHKRGIPIHMGRVNTNLRMAGAAQEIGSATVDGTSLAFGPRVNLERLERNLDQLNLHNRDLAAQEFPELGRSPTDQELYELAFDQNVTTPDQLGAYEPALREINAIRVANGLKTIKSAQPENPDQLLLFPRRNDLPLFSMGEQPELSFDAPQGTPEEIAAKLDASAATPGITVPALAAEVSRLSGRNLPQLASALGLPANPILIAQQLIAEQKAAKGAKRDDQAPEPATLPPRDPNETRELTPEERIQARRGEPEEAPEGTRPEDMEEEQADVPQPNPFLMASTGGVTAARVTPEQDAAYLAAVERGDMETAQKMVDEAAKAAGYSPDPVWRADSTYGGAPNVLDKGGFAGGVVYTAVTQNGAQHFARPGISEEFPGDTVRRFFVRTLKTASPSDVARVSQTPNRPADVSALLKEEKKALQAEGFDSARGPIRTATGKNLGDEIIVFSTDQIKLADPVTRDAQSNVIPLSQRFNPQSNDIRFSTTNPQRLIGKGATPDDVKRAMDALRSMLPNATTAWVGTRAELEAHLRKDRYFQRLWKEAYRTATGASQEQTDKAFEEMLATGLDGKEGFTFRGRTFLITDQIAVRESDGTPANAARRVLVHEDAHEGLRHLRDIDPEVEARWQSFRNAIPSEELDAVALRYPWLREWRRDPSQHDDVANEWLAAKIAEIERRGQPSPDSLFGKILQWIRGLVSKLFDKGHTVTEMDLLEFMDAARNARLRERAEASSDGLRFSASDPSGNLPAPRVIAPYLDQNDWAQTEEQAQRRSRYDLMSAERRAEYEAYQNDPNVPENLKYLAQFLGDPTTNVRLRQKLAPMIDFARNIMGGVNEDPAEVNEENTATAKQMTHDLLSNKTFSARLREEFQEWNQFTQDLPHAGDAMGAVLQMELMDYAVRLADQTGDTSLMEALLPFANDVILGDYVTMSGAARMMQVRSQASREGGVWNALRQAIKATEAAAEREVGGKENLTKLKTATDTTASEELADEVDAAIDAAVDNTVTGKAVQDSVEGTEEKPEDYDTDGFWERVLGVYQGEERAKLYAFQQEMLLLNRELQQVEAAEALNKNNIITPSLAEDAARLAKNPEELAALKKRIEERKKRILELVTELTTEETSGETKAKRRKMVRDPKVRKAVKALSETQQAQKMLDRFTNRNKRLKRERPAWKKAFEDQIKNPKPETEFTKTMEGHNVGEHTAHRLFLLAAKIREERRAARAARAAMPKAPRTPRAPKTAATAEQEAEAIIERATKESRAPRAATALQELRKDFMQGKITDDQFRERCTALGVTDETFDTLLDVTVSAMEARQAEREKSKAAREATKEEKEQEAALKTYLDKVRGNYTQPASERASDLKRDLKEGRITQAEYDAEITKLPKAKGPRRTDVKGFISSIAKMITQAPVRLQEDPAWKRQTVINAFMQRGMSPTEAAETADKLVSIIDKAIKEAQAKAAIRALKQMLRSKTVSPEKIGEAIRTRGIDPLHPHPVVAALAQRGGYTALTPAQFKRLAELDEAINHEDGPTMAAKHLHEMDRILARVRPRKTGGEIVVQGWINSALSSIGVLWLNWVHPLYVAFWKVGIDLAALVGDVATGKTKAIDAPAVIAQGMMAWVRGMEQFRAEASFALRNDTYRNRILEILTAQHSMALEMSEAAEKIKNGTPKEKVMNAAKFLYTATDFVRRGLASADQAWGSVLQHYVIQSQGLKMLVQRGGLTIEAAATILDKAVKDGQDAMASHLSAHGEEAQAEATLVGKDKMQASLKDAVSANLRDSLAGEELGTHAEKESYMELGNRLPESGAWFDPVNGLLELLKGLAASIRARNELAGRMLAGFITVGANILNRSAYFTPLGIGRALYRMHTEDGKKLYTETMATEGQARTRLVEGVVGTIGLALVILLRGDSDDDEGFVVTGQGPTNRSVKDAWLKAGHKPAHLEWVHKGQVVFSIPYSRGGLDHMAVPFTFAGALDDMQLEGRKAEKKNFNWGWAYAGTLLKNTAEQARFFGVKNLLATKPTSLKESSIAANVARPLAPFIPYAGFMRSVGALFSGSKDQSSWQSAVLAQLPLTNALMGEAPLNFLGDPVGQQSKDLVTHAMDRLEFSGFPFFVGIDTKSANADVYRLILTKGVAPAAPLRSTLEAANGFLTDAQWRNYVRTRGRIIKDEIRNRRHEIQFMPTPEAANAMEEISREATKAAKSQLNLD